MPNGGCCNGGGVFCGNTFISNAGAAVGPGACYQARSLVGVEIKPAEAERARVNRLLDEISRARFEPARMGGAAVSVKTVFVLASTTVRAKMPVTPKQSALPRGPEVTRG